MNAASFGVRYTKQFYEEIIHSNNEINLCASYKGATVGAICCRIEEAAGENHLYIVSLAVLPAYRGRGVGSQLLQRILETVEGNSNISKISLHVQVSNEDAIRYYTGRYGFKKVVLIQNYYQRLEPPHCYLLEKVL